MSDRGQKWKEIKCQFTDVQSQLLRAWKQCSRLKSLCEFHFEQLSNFSLSVGRFGSKPRCQSKNINMKYETHIKLVHELYGTSFQFSVKN